jgi:hypothetical protein
MRIVILARFHCSDFVLRSQALGVGGLELADGQRVTIVTASGDAKPAIAIRGCRTKIALRQIVLRGHIGDKTLHER